LTVCACATPPIPPSSVHTVPGPVVLARVQPGRCVHAHGAHGAHGGDLDRRAPCKRGRASRDALTRAVRRTTGQRWPAIPSCCRRLWHAPWRLGVPCLPSWRRMPRWRDCTGNLDNRQCRASWQGDGWRSAADHETGRMQPESCVFRSIVGGLFRADPPAERDATWRNRSDANGSPTRSAPRRPRIRPRRPQPSREIVGGGSATPRDTAAIFPMYCRACLSLRRPSLTWAGSRAGRIAENFAKSGALPW